MERLFPVLLISWNQGDIRCSHLAQVRCHPLYLFRTDWEARLVSPLIGGSRAPSYCELTFSLLETFWLLQMSCVVRF